MIKEVLEELTRHPEKSGRNRFLVISIGTGTHIKEKKYDARKASDWGVIGWLKSEGSTPLINAFSEANAEVVETSVPTFFKFSGQHKNYLRIQVILFGQIS